MARKKETKPESQKARLEKELIALIPEIEEEGLVFLIRQAQTRIHNQRTEKLNKEIEELNKKKRAGRRPATADGHSDAGAPVSAFSIEIDRSANGKIYYLIVNGRKHFLDIPEMQNLVALCYRPPSKSSALKYLHQFFTAERDEILMDHKISSPGSPFFEELFDTVRANFSFKG